MGSNKERRDMPIANHSLIVLKYNPRMNNNCDWCGQKCVDYIDLELGLYIERTGLPVCVDCAIEQVPHLVKLIELAITLSRVEKRINEAQVHNLPLTLIEQKQ